MVASCCIYTGGGGGSRLITWFALLKYRAKYLVQNKLKFSGGVEARVMDRVKADLGRDKQVQVRVVTRLKTPIDIGHR